MTFKVCTERKKYKYDKFYKNYIYYRVVLSSDNYIFTLMGNFVLENILI
ncbi:hypothetical protein pb186bvf_005111 [Paramecium bursaria]